MTGSEVGLCHDWVRGGSVLRLGQRWVCVMVRGGSVLWSEVGLCYGQRWVCVTTGSEVGLCYGQT